MAVTNLVLNNVNFGASKDSIFVRHWDYGIEGGRSLDMTGYTPDTIFAGHVVIRETATNEFKPMPVTGEPFASGSAYAALPSGHEIVGLVTIAKPTRLPMVAIIQGGSVNQTPETVIPYPYTDAIREALPNINFSQDY